MEPVGLGTLLLTPRQVTDLGNVSDLWYGDVLTHAGEARMYLKRATDEEILSECLCGVIGRAFELPIPRVFLVQDPQGLLGGQLLVGSEDAGMPSWKHFINLDADVAWEGLASWALLHDVAVFDEWIANPDRNTGNLLWDQCSGWALIDHARALGAWPPNSPVPLPDVGVRNVLARLIHQLPDDLEPRRLAKKAASCKDVYRQLDQQGAADAAQCQLFQMSTRAQDALSFLTARIEQLPSLVARHGPQFTLNL